MNMLKHNFKLFNSGIGQRLETGNLLQTRVYLGFECKNLNASRSFQKEYVNIKKQICTIE